MEYRILGKTGLRVSRMGLGGIPIQRIDPEGSRALIRKMLQAGVNYIDTARGYSVSEEYLGYALEGVRKQFILATKSMARTRDAMTADIARSLANLRTEYIDLYQVHNPSPDQLRQICAPGGALEALQEAKKAGQVLHLGLTAHSLETFRMALELDWVESIMFPYNIVEQQGEELIALCAQKNVGFICMKPLAGGAIEDASTALRYILSNENVPLVIPGMASPEELVQNLAACNDSSPLTREELSVIAGIRSRLDTNFCRRCGYCAPCAAGIVIPNIFTFEAYLSRYGLEGWARDRYAALEKKASDCLDCGACEERCPYHLPIRRMLRTAAERFGA